MKKLIVVIALIAAILLPSAINAQTQSSIGKGYYAVTTKIKVRTRPTTSSPVLEEVGPECDTFPFYFNRGDVVKVLENSGEWVKIAIYTETSNGNDYGFVMKKFLTVPDQLPDGWWKKSYSNPAYITMEGIEKRADGFYYQDKKMIVEHNIAVAPEEFKAVCYLAGTPILTYMLP